ncbi:MAG: sulfotransferase, partial [Planctomycetota bacterium]
MTTTDNASTASTRARGPLDVPPARPPLTHPLLGANALTLLRVLSGNGWIPPSRWPHVALCLAACAGRAPFTWLERLLLAGRRKPAADDVQPLFIVGHWRSGTTHLHNLMNCSPRFGFITPLASGLPWELLTLATWLRPLLEKALPEDRYVDNVAVTPGSPQEDEIPLASMQPLSVFHANYFPRHFERNFNRAVFGDGVSPRAARRWQRALRLLYRKVAIQQRNPQLLIKNPVYTARLLELRELYPQAKFVHIYRNPYVVFRSTVHYYRRLLPELALQSFASLDIPDFVERSYVRLMREHDRQREQLPPGTICDVRFEDLEQAPLAALQRVYGELQLDGFDADRPLIEAYVQSMGGYRKNTYDFEPDVIERVERSWREWVERWGYESPAPAKHSESQVLVPSRSPPG